MSPMPMTTGQLRTKVSEMEIGDYIKADYRRSILDSIILNSTSSLECPITGTPTPGDSNQYFFYFIKVAKGLLISDRVVATNMNWDNINAGKQIQGRPTDSGNIIPTMTSNTSPSGVASASNEQSGYEAWRAFDKLNAIANSWTGGSSAPVGWLAYQFPTPKKVIQYAIKSKNATPTHAPKSWTFEGSNDGLIWDVLDTQIAQISTSVNEVRSYQCKSQIEYVRYRINVSESNGSQTFIAELEMYETVGTIRSLTGGVAYSDANGNMSLTDQGFGAWPQNNEWNKFIVGFPADKIQSGKTLDDVFHWKNILTWTQDTLSASLKTSTYRTVRGYTTANTLATNRISSTSESTVGFRPAFEYQES